MVIGDIAENAEGDMTVTATDESDANPQGTPDSAYDGETRGLVKVVAWGIVLYALYRIVT